MQIKVKKQLKNCELEISIDERDDKIALAKALVFEAPNRCGKCGSENVIWYHKKVKAQDGSGEYIYIVRRCLDCQAQSSLGEYQGGMGYFWKKWEVYIPTQGQNNTISPSIQVQTTQQQPIQQTQPITQQQNNDNNEELRVEDLPF